MSAPDRSAGEGFSVGPSIQGGGVASPAEHSPEIGALTTSLAAVLANTTGIVLCDLYDMYAVQDFIVGRGLMTHERVEPIYDVTDRLLVQFPRLAEAEPPPLKRDTLDGTKAACSSWVQSVSEHTGYSLTVEVRRG